MDFDRLLCDHSRFVLALYDQIASRGDARQNAALSPLSVSLCLAMAAAGAKGATLDQLASCLNLPAGAPTNEFCARVASVALPDAGAGDGPFISYASGVWAEQTLSLQAAFKAVLEKHFGVVARSADFLHEAERARMEINAWVKDETKGKIENLLPPNSVDQLTRLVLANALYFKGAWARKFEASHTVDEMFYFLNGDSIKVPMMTTKNKQEIFVQDSFKVLRLPYRQGKDERCFSMYIILPNEKDGLAELQKVLLDVNAIEELLIRRHEVEVGEFKLPKFKISSGFELLDALKSMGLVLPFSNEADFSGIVELSEASPLSISKIFHKAFVEVNEEGTEAAAATSAIFSVESLVLTFDRPTDFVADHPFLFFIKEDTTGVVLFVGHVTDPLQ